VLSAPWIDREGLGSTIPTITSSLLKYLSKANARKLERISVLPTSDPLVDTVTGFPVPLGEFSTFHYLPLATDAIVLLAQNPRKLKNYRAHSIQTRA
jgi:hypothetical protein